MSFWTLFLAVVLANGVLALLGLGLSYLARHVVKWRIERAVRAGIAAIGLEAPASPAGPAPCPYCGCGHVGIARIPPHVEIHPEAAFYVRCEGCLACGPTRSTPEGAEDGWNAVARRGSVDRF